VALVLSPSPVADGEARVPDISDSKDDITEVRGNI